MSASMFIILILSFNAIIFVEASGHLPIDEINALKEIADEVGKKDWDFRLNPCDNNSNWRTPDRDHWYTNALKCNCSFPGGICHVQSLYLVEQDLQGVLPPSLVKLPFLKIIELSYNYLSGTIPLEWASTKLEYIHLDVNRLSGPIPKYLENITTLIRLSLNSNMFNGTIPPELGNLTNLQYLSLSGNYLTGELPKELNALTNLRSLRLSSNNFTGKMPSFQHLKSLLGLELEASGFEGPIPENNFVPTSLIELRVSDVNGAVSSFPTLNDMTNMTELILRRCNISGNLPDLHHMTQLGMIDLSFNNLEGGISGLQGLQGLQGLKEDKMQYFYIDLSYNNFEESSMSPICNQLEYLSIPLPRAQQLVSEPSDILFRICFKNNMAAKFEIEKFNGKNFSLWKLKVKAILRKDNCLAAISERPVDFTDDKKWSEMNEDAMADLYLSIADGVLSSIEEKKTAKEIWDHRNINYLLLSVDNRLLRLDTQE